MQTNGINGFTLLRQWSCSWPATCQCAYVNQKQPMAYCTAVLCCSVILTKARHWTYYSACVLFVDVEPYRPTVLRHHSAHWHCCMCSYCHNISSSGSSPVFLECTSGMYLSIYPRIIYPAFVASWFPRSVYVLKCFVYSGILMSSCVWFTTALYWTLDWTARMIRANSCLLWRLSPVTGRCMCRHMV